MAGDPLQSKRAKDGYSTVVFTFATTSASYLQGKLQQNYGGSGSFRKDDGDSSEKVKKEIGLLKTTTLHFFIHFFAVTTRLQGKNV